MAEGVASGRYFNRLLEPPEQSTNDLERGIFGEIDADSSNSSEDHDTDYAPPIRNIHQMGSNN
ncbi:MAG: hypothetical protein MHPSP_001493, partial [Paramarteilia canceri]